MPLSRSLSLPLSLRMVVGKRQEFLGPQAAGTSCPCPTGGVVASGGPRALILVGSILGLLSVRGVCPGPLLLSNGSQSKSISIPAARRPLSYRFLLFEKEVPRALARLTPLDFACPACIDISEPPLVRPALQVLHGSTFRPFIAVLESYKKKRKKRVCQHRFTILMVLLEILSYRSTIGGY